MRGWDGRKIKGECGEEGRREGLEKRAIKMSALQRMSKI